MKGWKPPLIMSGTGAPNQRKQLPDMNAQEVPAYLSREELKAFKMLRSQGKFSIFNVKSCPCGAQIPNSRDFCSQKCWKASDATI